MQLSSAGGFALYLLRGKHTNLFDNYIAATPALSMNSVNQFENLFDEGHKFNKSIYVTMGGFEAQKRAIRPESIVALIKLLKEKSPDNLVWHYNDLPEQNHMTTPYLTLYRGLTNVFSHYKAPKK